jgi:hypothetical protein
MDPKACIDLIVLRWGEGSFSEAWESVLDYRAWRAAGGFEPLIAGVRGDIVVWNLARRIPRRHRKAG